MKTRRLNGGLPKAAVGEKKANGIIDGINESIMKQLNFFNCGMVDEFDEINYGMGPCGSNSIKEKLTFLY